MKGCRPLSKDEVEQVLQSFSGVYAKRNRALFILGVKAGFRISELLSLRVGDVRAKHGTVLDRVTVARRYMKGKREGRTVHLHYDARTALHAWLEAMEKALGRPLDPDLPVFCSHKRDQTGMAKAISRVQAWRILDAAFDACEITGKLGTHCLRKTFAQNIYEKTGHDLLAVKTALGHTNISTTERYLGFAIHAHVVAAILAA
jgi:site-specific recombinase XerD